MCYVKHQIQNNVAQIILARPKKRNALNRAMISELYRIFCSLAADPLVSSVAITGTGPDFCAGADLDEMQGRGSLVKNADIERANKLMDCIGAFPKPVTAQLHGHVLGGGLELALACHRRVTDSSGVFAFPEMALGFLPAWGGTVRLPKLIGHANAAMMIHEGLGIGAASALEWGLVDEVIYIDQVAIKPH